jgi:predicted ArsR family transcriptional regulator
MPRSSDDRLLVLHGLRLKGFALADAIAEQVGVGAATVTSVLGELEADGLVQYRDGRLTGWALTTEGRREHERSLNDELNEAGCREDVLGAYKRFLALNHELLELCTRWQLREVGGEQIMNDHSDTAHDAAVLDDLAALHARVEPICADLAALFDRFGAYGERL